MEEKTFKTYEGLKIMVMYSNLHHLRLRPPHHRSRERKRTRTRRSRDRFRGRSFRGAHESLAPNPQLTVYWGFFAFGDLGMTGVYSAFWGEKIMPDFTSSTEKHTTLPCDFLIHPKVRFLGSLSPHDGFNLEIVRRSAPEK